MRKRRKLLRLSAMEWRLLSHAILALARVRMDLWLFSLQRLLRGFDRPHTGTPNVPEISAPSPEQIAWAVGVASRYVPGTRSCLPRALAAQRLLRRFGHPASFRMGVTRTTNQEIEAHAWVESGDRVVIGAAGMERYAPLPSTEAHPT